MSGLSCFGNISWYFFAISGITGAAEVELLSDDLRLFSGYFWQILANSGYFLATVWLILANPGYSWQILAMFLLILGNYG